jgi:hypothetical protein
MMTTPAGLKKLLEDAERMAAEEEERKKKEEEEEKLKKQKMLAQMLMSMGSDNPWSSGISSALGTFLGGMNR